MAAKERRNIRRIVKICEDTENYLTVAWNKVYSELLEALKAKDTMQIDVEYKMSTCSCLIHTIYLDGSTIKCFCSEEGDVSTRPDFEDLFYKDFKSMLNLAKIILKGVYQTTD